MKIFMEFGVAIVVASMKLNVGWLSRYGKSNSMTWINKNYEKFLCDKFDSFQIILTRSVNSTNFD